MAHFAKIENSIVTEVIVINNQQEHRGIDHIKNDLKLDGDWIQTSYSGKIRKNFAGIGFKYDKNRDAFIPPKLFNSWKLDEETCTWIPPIPYPTDEKMYYWDEDILSWVEFEEENA
jgi:hypothetical protein